MGTKVRSLRQSFLRLFDVFGSALSVRSSFLEGERSVRRELGR